MKHIVEAFKVEKVWGSEHWLENNDKYCMKVLYIAKGASGSLHRHPIKDETFLVVGGVISLELHSVNYLAERAFEKYLHGEKAELPPRLTFRMETGQYLRIPPGVWHRFIGIEDATIIECSTSHDEADVERLVPSKAAT